MEKEDGRLDKCPQLVPVFRALHDRRHGGNLPMPSGENSRLFTLCTGQGWPYSQVITLFQRLRYAAQIKCPEGELHPPRLHEYNKPHVNCSLSFREYRVYALMKSERR